jgi:small-conductance mechanosensitive channel
MQKLQETFSWLSSLQIWENNFFHIAIAVGCFLALYLSFWIVRFIALNIFENWAQKRSFLFGIMLVQALKKISGWFYSFLALYITLYFFIELPENVQKIVDGFFVILLLFQFLRVSQIFIAYIFGAFIASKTEGEGEKEASVDQTILNAIRMVMTVAIWTIGILVILSHLGVNVSTLVASLGIGGIAIALAAQNILGDIFASFSLYFDRPFKIGDFIIVGKDSGVVKDIGMKTTRIQTLQGEELVIPNRELTESRVQNFKKMEKRRVVFSFGVVYATVPQKLQKIPHIVKQVIQAQKKSSFDRAHFFRFGESSLDFEVVYFVESSEYNIYMDTQQAINFGILNAFEKEEIEMAFPTRTVYVK